MIRHGQSAANADTSIYNRVPDYRIPLTDLGVEQARIAGEEILRRKLDGQQVCVYVSPYLRAYQTLEALNLGSLIERVIEEPGFANRTGPTSRSPGRSRTRRNSATPMATSSTASAKESPARTSMTGCLPSWRRSTGTGQKTSYAPNTLLVTHGLTMRLFCMRWFHWSVEYFESLNNPDNAEVRTLMRNDGEQYSWTYRSASGCPGMWTIRCCTHRGCVSSRQTLSWRARR